MDSDLFERLAAPLSADEPCGEDLEDTQLLASFDALRLFGQMTPPESWEAEKQPNWREVRNQATEALERSRDIRLLAHLAAAGVRLDGIAGLCRAVSVAGSWFNDFPDAVYPRVDEDAILRKNALNQFSDPMVIVNALRKQPIVANPQLGAFGLIDFEIASGQKTPAEGAERVASETEIRATLTATPVEALQALEADVSTALEALRRIENVMLEGNGPEAAPDFDPLIAALTQIHAILRKELDQRSATGSTDEAGADGESGGGAAAGVIAVGSVRSREDAIRALDAVAEFFRRNEPSSPIPIIVERAKRLVAMDFLELLADLAPDGVDQVKHIGGIRDE